LVATEVLFALPMIARRNRLPLRRRGIIGGLGVASGMAIFVAVSPPSGGVSVPRLAAWAPAEGRTRTGLMTGGTAGMGQVIAARPAADGFDVAGGVNTTLTIIANALRVPVGDHIAARIGTMPRTA
jgi:hypothetical protein